MSAAIDRPRYLTLPLPKARRQVAFARLLRKRKPKTPTPELEQADVELEIGIVAMKKGLFLRHLERNAASLAGEEVDLDQFVDHLWSSVVADLEKYRVFQRPAAQRLAAKQTQNGFDYQKRIALAQRADEIHQRLFGDLRLEFTTYKFPEQSEYMDTLWEVIEHEEYQESLTHMCGEDIFGALRDSHEHYKEMVDQRTLREQGSGVNLKALQIDLQSRILNFVIALLAMIKDHDSSNVEIMRAALRPIDALREQLERERGRGSTSPTPDEDEAEINELLAEEQALSESLDDPPTLPPTLPPEQDA